MHVNFNVEDDELVDNNLFVLFCIAMMTKKKHYIVLTILTLSLGLLFFPICTFAADITDFTGAISSISTSLFNKSSSVEDAKSIVETYCSAVFSSPSFIDNNFVYTAKHSAFVYLLCNEVRENWSLLDPKLFKHSKFNELWLVEYDEAGNNLCDSIGPNCDLATQIPNLYNMIVADYVNMKQSNIYGLSQNATLDDDIKAQVNRFSLAYFGINICETSDRSYDKTCRTMKSYIKNARNLLSDVSVFSATVLLDITQPIIESDLAICSNKESLDYNPIVCGLYGDTTTSFVSFQNLVYNELFYYRLFVGYYLTMLQKNPVILTKSIYNNYSKIAKKFSSQYTRSKSASSLTFRMLRDMYTAFPFHIGMLMYKEDLDGFGKVISAIATPIYTLYDKLRNVQAPK